MPESPIPHVDGRDARWSEHREQRRVELTESAMRSIRRHGAGVGMDEIAAEAHTSKTVIYRHLGDRLGLYLAVCASVDAQILGAFGNALEGVDAPESSAERGTYDVLVAAIDSYLSLVELDPEIYRFVMRPPQVQVLREADPMTDLSSTIAARLTEPLTEHLTQSGQDPRAASLLAHGLVGFVRDAADHWLTDPARASRARVVAQLADFAAAGIAGIRLEGAPA